MSNNICGHPHVYTIVNRISDLGEDVIVVDFCDLDVGGRSYLVEMISDRTDSTWVFESNLRYKGIKGIDCYIEEEQSVTTKSTPEIEPVAIIDLDSHKHYYYTDDVLMRMHEQNKLFYIIASDGSLLESTFDISFKKVK